MLVKDSCNRNIQYEKKEDILIIHKEDVLDGAEYLDVVEETFTARVGDAGYYVISDCDGHGSAVCKFNEKEDGERIYKQNLMPVFGVKKENETVLVIVEGYRYEFSLVYGIKKGEYYIYPRFRLYGSKPYEDIIIRFVYLPKTAEYSEMAVAYRNYKLSKGDCVPLREKMKGREALQYAVESPEIRIRLGWKETPPKILEQTLENEPEMKVACTFDRVKDIVDELKKQGVPKAQLCLIGWNVSGHDGRYPDVFPVEGRLGGEEKLKELIAYAQENGYQIVCHTNSTDCYSISNRFKDDIVIKKEDGTLSINELSWSGGRMYHLCPEKAYEYAMEDLPKIRDLGFMGLHYVDVLSVSPLRNCFDKNHPCNSRESLQYYEKIMQLCYDKFGGFASEGVFDFTVKYLDYGLYVVFSLIEDDFIDENIPFWEIVYHGIVLYNPMTNTVNYTIKDKTYGLNLMEYGGRPAFYFYSKHIEGAENQDWLGKEDLLCDTDEQLHYSVSKIKEAYDTYREYQHLQTEFIDKHEKVGDNVYCVTYSNGTKVYCDYSNQTIKKVDCL